MRRLLSDCIFFYANFRQRCTYCTARAADFQYHNQRLTDFPVTYKAKDVEQGWYDIWQRNKYFAPSKEKTNSGDEISFNIVLPPPNITGILHLGHALTVTIQDILARWHRMKGHSVLWIPGLDHAGIATQVVVEKHLRRTHNLSRLDLGREEFSSLLWKWKAEKADAIKNQLRNLGATLDWDREYFTIDENHSTAVMEAFIQLYNCGLLYRGCDLVNWSPTLRSTISEIEVEHFMISGKTKLYVPGYESKVTFGRMVKIAFPIENSKEELIVATTRPETIFGDVAIAVHPNDERYAEYVGRRVLHPIRDIPIPVIADTTVKREFGTGAVKITPAHDRSDYHIAKKHNLPLINVIDEDGNMTKACKEYEGLPRFIVRDSIMNELSIKNILRGIEDNHKMMLSRCSRSQDIVEHIIKEQWYVRCEKMAKKAIDALENGSLKIEPDVHSQLWEDWLGNVRDWCISRQLWWGHHIPAYFVDGDTSWIVARSEEEAYSIAWKKYGNDVKLRQDPDVLDTWFSSAIVPFAIFGWPKETQDMSRYYPLSLMETGHDILMFWVAKMVMLGLELTQRLPFKEILLHGILCDANGRKMSKSSGNVISPENIINGCNLKELDAQARHNYAAGILSAEELHRTLRVNAKSYPEGIFHCGADALRMTLCGHNIKNRNISFDIADCRKNNHFCNKIWQVSKYVLLVAQEQKREENIENLSNLDRWILSRLSGTVETVNIKLAKRDFHEAIMAIHEFLHYEFCDLYVEGTKFGFRDGDTNIIFGHSYTLKRCLEVSLRLLSPIAPYLADDLYTRLAKKLSGFLPVSSLLEAAYPDPEEFKHMKDISMEEEIRKIMDLINIIRSIIANISKKSNPEVNILVKNAHDYNLYKTNVNLIKGASRIWNVIPIHLTKDYKMVKQDENCDSVRYIITDDCSLLITTMDTSVIELIKRNIARKQESISKEKLQNCIN